MTTKLSNAKTREAVATMMKENTGRHILDSGGAYGRRFEQLANVELDETPTTYVKHGSFYKSMYHHLVDNLIVDEEMTRDFIAFSELPENKYDSWSENLNNYTLSKKYRAISGDGTYNYDNVLDGNYSWFVVETDDEDDTLRVIIQTHNGCDIRGGYSTPVFFTYKSYDEELHDIATGYLYCPNSSEHHYETHDGAYWYDSEDGCTRVSIEEDKDGNLLCPQCNAILEA